MAQQAVGAEQPQETVKVDRRRGRTTVSLAAMQELQGMARKLNDYRCRTGTVVVSRSENHKALAEWAFNLRDTYKKIPNGRRVAWISKRFPELHEAMVRWASKEASTPRSKAPSFEVQAAVFMEYLVRFNRAPSQNAACSEEAALAKWLSRRLSMEAKTRSQTASEVLVVLQGECERLRGKTGGKQNVMTYRHALYDLVAAIWSEARGTASEDEKRVFKERVLRREVFWESPDWMLGVEASPGAASARG